MNAGKSRLPDIPTSLVTACAALGRLGVAHRAALREGGVLRSMLREAAHMINQPECAKDAASERRRLQNFVAQIEKAADVAKDSAEGEQRIIAESPARGGHAEKDAERYFALSAALRKLAADCRREALV